VPDPGKRNDDNRADRRLLACLPSALQVWGTDAGKPVPDAVVDCVFTDIPVELQEDVRRYHELVSQRKELDRKLGELGTRTVRRLRLVAGFTDDDSATVLGISRQRVNQLRNASAAS
jgi:hypothetical protein